MCPFNASGLGNYVATSPFSNLVSSNELCALVETTVKAVRSANSGTTILGMNRDAVKSIVIKKPVKPITSYRDLENFIFENLASVGVQPAAIRATFDKHALAIVLIYAADRGQIVLRYPEYLVECFDDAVKMFPECADAFKRQLERQAKRPAPEETPVFAEKSTSELFDLVFVHTKPDTEAFIRIHSIALSSYRRIQGEAGKGGSNVKLSKDFDAREATLSGLFKELERYDPVVHQSDKYQVFSEIFTELRDKIVTELEAIQASKWRPKQGSSLSVVQRFGHEGVPGETELDESMFAVARDFQTHIDLVMTLLKRIIDALKDRRLTMVYDQRASTSAVKSCQTELEKKLFVEPRHRELINDLVIALKGLSHPTQPGVDDLFFFTQLRPADSENETAFAQLFYAYVRGFVGNEIQICDQSVVGIYVKLYTFKQKDTARGKIVEAVGKQLKQIRQDMVRRGEEASLDHFVTMATTHAASITLPELPSEDSDKNRLLAESNPPNESSFLAKGKIQTNFGGPSSKAKDKKPMPHGKGNGNGKKPHTDGMAAKGKQGRHGYSSRGSAKGEFDSDFEQDGDSGSNGKATKRAAHFQNANSESAFKKAKRANANANAGAPSAHGKESSTSVDRDSYCALGTSVLDAYEETHPIHAELDTAVHCCHVRALRDLKARVQSAQFREELRKSSDSEDSDHSQSALRPDADVGTSQWLEAKFILRQNKHLNKQIRKAKRDGRTPRSQSAGVSEAACDSETSVPRGTLADETESIWNEPERATEANRTPMREQAESRKTPDQTESCRGDGSETSLASSTKRNIRLRSDSNRGDFYLGIEISDPKEVSCHVRQKDQDVHEKVRTVKSLNLSSQDYAIIDSGTTISIAANDEILTDFDVGKSTRVQGFNGSVTSSSGVGSIVGYLTDVTGRQIPFEVPNTHYIKGAPSNLLSVSALRARGYIIHFGPEEAYIKTPKGVIVDLVEKRGLFWLRWTRTKILPHEPRKVSLQMRSSYEPEFETEECFAERAAIARTLNHTKGCETCSLAYGSGKRIDLTLAHRRFGHFEAGKIARMCRSGDYGITLTNCKHTDCPTCRASKMTKNTVPKIRQNPQIKRRPFERVWTDVKGKLKPDFFGNQYFVTFTCEATRYIVGYACRQKSDVKTHFQAYLEVVKRHGYAVRLLNSDGGGEYTANENATNMSEFQKICGDNGIEQQFTSPHTSAQNGISERLNRTIMEGIRSIIHEAGLTYRFWGFAFRYVISLKNRIWHSALTEDGKEMSPHEALFGVIPDLSWYRVFGCDVHVYDFEARKDDVKPKGILCIFVGISASRKGWLVLDLRTMKVRTSYHCTFLESLAGRRCALTDRRLKLKQGEIPGDSEEEEDDSEVPIEEIFDVEGDTNVSLSDEHDGSGSDHSHEQKSLDSDDSYEQESSESEDSEAQTEPPRVKRTKRKSTVGGSTTNPKKDSSQPAEQTSSPLIREILQKAFDHDFLVDYMKRNPKNKGSEARERYERYKRARTLREAVSLGATFADIKWDYARGFFTIQDPANDTDESSTETDAGVDEPTHATTACLFEDSTNENDVERCAHALDLNGRSETAKAVIREIISESSTRPRVARCYVVKPIPIPKNRNEAMRSPYAREWREAERQELASLKSLGCFEKVSEKLARQHGKLVASKWVYTVKYNPDGSVQRFKARLVAKGFTQSAGVDYFETFSPVFSYNSLRLIFAISALKDLQLDIWDLKNGFIQQEIDVPHLYMRCPEGYKMYMPDGTNAALHCLKSIYGLKQSSRLLSQKMSAYLEKLGFVKLQSDECVYTRGTGQDYVIVGIWVDDIIVASARANDEVRKTFDKDLRNHFTMSPWTSGEAEVFLGIRIKRDWQQGTLHVSSERSIEKMTERFGLSGREGRAPHVPMNPDLKLTKTPDDEIVPAEVFDYRAAVGAVLYLAMTTRPDVAQSIGILCRFASCPGQEHVNAIKQVIRYLYGTKTFGITYSKYRGNYPHRNILEVKPLEIVAYADADFAGDESTRRSTSGFVIILAGAVICWLSKLQPTVALSTTEAETNASVEAVKIIMHLRLLLTELGIPQKEPTIVHEDNSAALAIVHGENAKRTKHYQIKVHFLREQKERGEFEYEKVTTKEQLADAFTKALPRFEFERCRKWMGMAPA